MAYIVDLRSRRCDWCGMGDMDVRVFDCPACGRSTCYECVRLYDESTCCDHTTPAQRRVLTRQDWRDD